MSLDSQSSALDGKGELNNDDLCEICEQRDEERFVQLLQALHAEVFAYVRRKLRSVADADDVLQQAYVNALGGFRKSQFDASKKLRPWFYAIAMNAVTDFVRKEHRHRHTLHIDVHHGGDFSDDLNYTELVTVDDPPDARMERQEEEEAIAARLGALQEHERAILEMFLNGMKHREIADALNVPLGTVKSRLDKAKKEFRKAA